MLPERGRRGEPIAKEVMMMSSNRSMAAVFICMFLFGAVTCPGPEQAWFDKTWRPSEIELVE